MKGVVVAGVASGVGKTTATLAFVHALQSEGYDVQLAKIGPDYIDPSVHGTVADRPSRTLDPWLQGDAGLRRNYHRGEGDVCVVEGMMGLYDGDVASTAGVAASLDLPIVLVVDAGASVESVAATALGFRAYARRLDVDLTVSGVVAQRVAGERHAQEIRDALPAELSFYGWIPADERLAIPERHLGLHRGEEVVLDDETLDDVTAHLEPDRILDVATAPPIPAIDRRATGADVSIGLALDEACTFVYPATRERLAHLGTVETFSPVAGDPLPDVDVIYLPGGYPELHAETLAESPTLDALVDRAAAGVPIYGECGGMMLLAESLTTADGGTYSMANVLPVQVEMCDSLQAIEHVRLRGRADSPVATAGESRRGHEFHQSRAAVDRDARFAFDVERGRGIDDERDGLMEYDAVGTYCHTHPESGTFDALVSRLS